ncbi:hypothetical protein NMG60_11029519 [Bertholletia excelsa]
MVLLVERIYHSLKHFSKLENHHRPHESEALSASLQAFRSDVSNCLAQLSSKTKPDTESWSLRWIHQCFEVLSEVDKAFAKLVTDIDHPISKWEDSLIDEYLQYSLKLLDLLNSISSSLSHLGQARLALSHALTLVHTSPQSAIERLRPIQFKSLGNVLKEENEEKSKEEIFSSDKERVLHESFTVLETASFRLCGIVISGLSGEIKPFPEMKEVVNGGLGEKKGIIKEVKEVNEAVESVAQALAMEKSWEEACQVLEMKLEEMQNILDAIGEETDGVFSKILAARTELLDTLRQRQQQEHW